jgi:phosphoglycolate phosphatase
MPFMSLSKFSAVLFDFDGTLADSYDAIAASVNHVRAAHGLPPLSVEEVKKHVGRGPNYLLQHTVPNCRLPQDLSRYRAHHPTVMRSMTRLLPGAAELLPGLLRAGKKIGLCSNKPRAFSMELLHHLGIDRYFSVVLGPEDVPAPKPAPDMLLRALHQLALPREQVVYIGDMTVDIQTARAAGLQVWITPTGSDDRAVLEAARPDRLLTNLTEIVAELPQI